MSDEHPEPIEGVFYRWWLIDERTGKRRRTSWSMTPATVREHHQGAEADLSSAEARGAARGAANTGPAVVESVSGLACACGGERFERVVVQRKFAAPYRTDFAACVQCRAMFHVPAGDVGEAERLRQFKEDAKVAAADYRKPSRR